MTFYSLHTALNTRCCEYKNSGKKLIPREQPNKNNTSSVITHLDLESIEDLALLLLFSNFSAFSGMNVFNRENKIISDNLSGIQS